MSGQDRATVTSPNGSSQEAQPTDTPQQVVGSPFGLIDDCLALDINSLQTRADNGDALSSFCLAVHLERRGDYNAEKFYERAIEADPNEPIYESFYADY